MRKRIVWAAAIFLTAGLMACDSNESFAARIRKLAGGKVAAQILPDPIAQTTITALVWAPDWPDQMHQLAAAFTQENPDIAVEVQFMIGSSVEENLKPKAASGTLPDIVSINPNAYAARLADSGALADIGQTAVWRSMLPALQPEWTSDAGKKFGIPGGVVASLIYYNKAMFAQAGIERLPENFDDFLAVCEKLRRAQLTPLVWSGGFPNMLAAGPFSAGFANNVVAADPDWKRKLETGGLDLDQPAVADIFDKVRLLPDRGYTQADYMNTGYDDSMALFTRGKVAMAFSSTRNFGVLGRPADFPVGMFIPPWNAAGKEAVPVIGSETGFAVSTGANQAAATRFLEFMFGRGLAIQHDKRQNIVPLADPPPELQSDSTVMQYVRQVQGKKLKAEPYYAYLPSNTLALLHPLLQDVLLGRTTPRQAAQALDRSVRNEAMRDFK